MAQPKPSCSKDGPRSLAWHPPRHWYKGDWHTQNKPPKTHGDPATDSEAEASSSSVPITPLTLPSELQVLSAGFVCAECGRTCEPECSVPVMASSAFCRCECLLCLLSALSCLAQRNCLRSDRTMQMKGWRRKRLELTSFMWIRMQQQLLVHRVHMIRSGTGRKSSL